MFISVSLSFRLVIHYLGKCLLFVIGRGGSLREVSSLPSRCAGEGGGRQEYGAINVYIYIYIYI